MTSQVAITRPLSTIARLFANKALNPPALTFGRNVGWSFFGNVAYALCQWAVLIVIARSSGAAAVGAYAFALAVTTPVVMFSMLSLRKVQVTDVNSHRDFHTYLALRFITSFMAIISVTVLSFFATSAHSSHMIIWFIGCAKCLDAIGDIFQGFFQASERLSVVGKSYALNGVVTVVLSLFAAVISHNLVFIAAASTISSLFVLVAYLIPKYYSFNDQTFRFSFGLHRRLGRPIWQLTTVSFPLGISALLIALRVNMPRYFVEHSLDSVSLGIFAAVSYLLLAGNTIVSAMAQVALPRLSRLYNDHNVKGFLRLTIFLMATSVLMVLMGLIVSLIFGRTILHATYGAIYANHLDIFLILILSCLFYFPSWFLECAMLAAKSFHSQLFLQIFLVSASLLASALLIQRWQLRGAAWSILFVSLLEFMMRSFVLTRIIVRVSRFAEAGENA